MKEDPFSFKVRVQVVSMACFLMTSGKISQDLADMCQLELYYYWKLLTKGTMVGVGSFFSCICILLFLPIYLSSFNCETFFFFSFF